MFEDLSLPLPRLVVSASPPAETNVDALVEAHAAVLFRVAHALLRNRAEAEDTVQDTFVRVLQHRAALPAVREMRPWLIRITWNLALDRRRRKRPDQAEAAFLETLVSPGAGSEQQFSNTEQARHVLAAIDRLPGAEREVLLLAALEELSTAEIGVVMGKSESAVRALLFRARGRLRERLEGRGRRAGRS